MNMEQAEAFSRLRALAAESESWADFFNDIFGKEGALTRLIPDAVQRGAFLRTKKVEIKRLLDETIALLSVEPLHCPSGHNVLLVS